MTVGGIGFNFLPPDNPYVIATEQALASSAIGLVALAGKFLNGDEKKNI